MSGRPLQDAQVPYLQVARRPRMIGLLVLLLAVAAVCGRLGAWQLDRAQEGRAAPTPAPAVALADVLSPQETFRGELAGRVVVVEGRFGDDQVLVPRRGSAGGAGASAQGSWVVAPVTVTGSGAVLAVVRGWMADGDDVPAVPDGVVRLEGWLEPGEASTGQAVTSVSPAQLVNRWGGPIYSGYLVLTDPVDTGLVAVAAPEPESAWDLQNIAYAAQWWLFAGAAVLLWVRIVRDEAVDRAVSPGADVAAGP